MRLKRLLAGVVAAGLIAFVLTEVAVLADLYTFEFSPLYSMLGWQGLATIALINAAALSLLWTTIEIARGRVPRFPKSTGLLVLLAAFVGLWIIEWMFLEVPLSIRREVGSDRFVATTLPPAAEKDFRRFSLAQHAISDDALARLRVMYARAMINNTDSYSRNPLGSTIDRNAARYGIEPTFLFFRAYLISYYGEATSGPVPFLRSLTSEGIRDLVQIHLPGWFVESSVRRYLISSSFLPSIFGEAFGTKLRYAIHKATLDVSAQPYDLSTYSDVFAVLKEFPDQFPDVLAPGETDPLRANLRDSFMALADTALLVPFEEPYLARPYPESYYDEHREDLKRFARAAYYVTVSDFDFATRVQALLSAHHAGIYRARLSDELWNSLPDWQRQVMLAMPRDLFTPNIGRLAYNLYAIPELNCTPVEYIAASAAAERAQLQPTMASVWRPPNRDYLWAAAGYQLTVMNEIWALVNATPMPGINTNDTVDFASQVVAMNASRLDD